MLSLLFRNISRVQDFDFKTLSLGITSYPLILSTQLIGLVIQGGGKVGLQLFVLKII